MTLQSSDVLFVGKGSGVVPWYRCGMVSFALGCDFAGIIGSPPELTLLTSLKRGGHSMPKFDDYKIIVLQQVHGAAWLREIIRLKQKGIFVIYEVDDYLHGVRKIDSHKAKEVYNKKRLAEHELCMKACDAMICSTQWLADTYRKFNRNVFLCKNGIEAARYKKYNLPERKTLNIGWAGGEGHLESVRQWLPAVERILDEHPETRFLSMGLGVAKLLKRPTQATCLPFISIENFPGSLCNFDIGLAPAGRGSFFHAKSDLRFLECGALGIPVVADPFVYDDIAHEQTGLLASNQEQAYKALKLLVTDSELRNEIGYNARDYVLNNRSVEVAIEQWEKVFISVASGDKIPA